MRNICQSSLTPYRYQVKLECIGLKYMHGVLPGHIIK